MQIRVLSQSRHTQLITSLWYLHMVLSPISIDEVVNSNDLVMPSRTPGKFYIRYPSLRMIISFDGSTIYRKLLTEHPYKVLICLTSEYTLALRYFTWVYL
jgi:hypothetical protein